jgi:hypothetical protein
MYNAHRRFFPFTEHFCIDNARVIDGKIRYFKTEWPPPYGVVSVDQSAVKVPIWHMCSRILVHLAVLHRQSHS